MKKSRNTTATTMTCWRTWLVSRYTSGKCPGDRCSRKRQSSKVSDFIINILDRNRCWINCCAWPGEIPIGRRITSEFVRVLNTYLLPVIIRDLKTKGDRTEKKKQINNPVVKTTGTTVKYDNVLIKLELFYWIREFLCPRDEHIMKAPPNWIRIA